MTDDDRELETGEAPRRNPKTPVLCGADAELGNFVSGVESPLGTSNAASKLLLRQIDGIPQHSYSSWGWGGSRSSSSWGGSGWTSSGYTSYADRFNAEDAAADDDHGGGYNSQDWGRKFLATNGGCVYIDLQHLELCIPEVRSAYDFVAAWHAMLRIAQTAQRAANARLKPGLRIEALVNNSDGLGSSYGSHLNFLVSRRLWDDIFARRLHYLLYLASYQVSSIIVTGQGKVGAENDAPAVDFQLAQRADHFETLFGLQTTYRRPIVNTRDEALCGPPSYVYSKEDGSRWRVRSKLARLHVIFYDSNLCHVACLLKVGMMQILLAMLEEGRMRPELILDDPIDAVLRYSHDRTLRAKARTAGGERLSALDWQLRFLDEATRFVAQGGCEGVVPFAREILEIQADTLQKLQRGELDALMGRLDWVLKLRALEQAMARRPGLTWESPAMKHLDHVYCSLDRDTGLYWAYEKDRRIERVVEDDQIERLVHEPPDDTRAWTRAMLLRAAGRDRVQHVDWDEVEFKGASSMGWPLHRSVNLADPAALGRDETGHVFTEDRPLDEILDELNTERSVGYVSETTWTPTGSTSYPQPQALLPAPEQTTARATDSLAVYDCGSWQPPEPPKEE